MCLSDHSTPNPWLGTWHAVVFNKCLSNKFEFMSQVQLLHLIEKDVAIHIEGIDLLIISTG